MKRGNNSYMQKHQNGVWLRNKKQNENINQSGNFHVINSITFVTERIFVAGYISVLVLLIYNLTLIH